MQEDRQLLAHWLAVGHDHTLKTASDLLLLSLEDAHLHTRLQNMSTVQYAVQRRACSNLLLFVWECEATQG